MVNRHFVCLSLLCAVSMLGLLLALKGNHWVEVKSACFRAATGLQNQNPRSDGPTPIQTDLIAVTRNSTAAPRCESFGFDPTQENSLAHPATDNLFPLISTHGLLKFPVGVILTFS